MRAILGKYTDNCQFVAHSTAFFKHWRAADFCAAAQRATADRPFWIRSDHAIELGGWFPRIASRRPLDSN